MKQQSSIVNLANEPVENAAELVFHITAGHETRFFHIINPDRNLPRSNLDIRQMRMNNIVSLSAVQESADSSSIPLPAAKPTDKHNETNMDMNAETSATLRTKHNAAETLPPCERELGNFPKQHELMSPDTTKATRASKQAAREQQKSNKGAAEAKPKPPARGEKKSSRAAAASSKDPTSGGASTRGQRPSGSEGEEQATKSPSREGRQASKGFAINQMKT